MDVDDLLVPSPAPSHPPPVSPTSADEEQLRHELESYLQQLRGSSAVDMPDNFDDMVNALVQQPRTTDQTEPSWMIAEHTHIDINTDSTEAQQPAASIATEHAETKCTESNKADLVSAIPTTTHSPPAQPDTQPSAASITTTATTTLSLPSLSSLSHSLDELSATVNFNEEEEMRKIAELDALIQDLTLKTEETHRQQTYKTNTVPNSNTSDSQSYCDTETHNSSEGENTEQPRRVEYEDDPTFLTAIPRQRQEEEKQTITIADDSDTQAATTTTSENAEQDGGSSPAADNGVQETNNISTTRPALIPPGDGFTLSLADKERLSVIDTLINSLHTQEKEGKRCRFIARKLKRQTRQMEQLKQKEETTGNDNKTTAAHTSSSSITTYTASSIQKQQQQSPHNNKSQKHRQNKTSSTTLPAIHPAASPTATVVEQAPSSSSSSSPSYADTLSVLLDSAVQSTASKVRHKRSASSNQSGSNNSNNPNASTILMTPDQQIQYKLQNTLKQISQDQQQASETTDTLPIPHTHAAPDAVLDLDIDLDLEGDEEEQLKKEEQQVEFVLFDYETHLSQLQKPSSPSAAGASSSSTITASSTSAATSLHQIDLTEISSVSDWYKKKGFYSTTSSTTTTATNTDAADDSDPYAFLDAGVADDSHENVQLDQEAEQNSIFPDSDEEDYQEKWQQLLALPAAPDVMMEPAASDQQQQQGLSVQVLSASTVSACVDDTSRRLSGLLSAAEQVKKRLSQHTEQINEVQRTKDKYSQRAHTGERRSVLQQQQSRYYSTHLRPASADESLSGQRFPPVTLK